MKAPAQIVLFRFPQTDLAEGKLRRALLPARVPGLLIADFGKRRRDSRRREDLSRIAPEKLGHISRDCWRTPDLTVLPRTSSSVYFNTSALLPCAAEPQAVRRHNVA